jgi:phage terminase large subunit-like protein
MYVVSLMAGYADDSYLYKQEVEGLFVTPEGSIGDRRWFDNKVLKEIPETRTNGDEEEDVVIEDRVRYWDLAATEKKIKVKRGKKQPDETVGTLMSWDGEDFYIEHQEGGRWLWEDILDVIYRQKFFREGDSTHKPLPHFKIEGHRPEGDKVMRANIWFAEASKGNVYLIEGDWNDPFLDQVDVFADGEYDDRVDSASGARLNVAPIISWATVPFMKL